MNYQGHSRNSLSSFTRTSPRSNPAPTVPKTPQPQEFVPSPPNAPEAEQAVLGACLIERDAVVAVIPILKSAHFYQQRHAIIFEAIVACFDDPSLAYDGVFTVATYLQNVKAELDFDAFNYAFELHSMCATAKNAEAYAKAVVDAAIKRELLSAAEQVKHEVHYSGKPVEELSGGATVLFAEIGQGRTRTRAHTVGELADTMMERLIHAYQSGTQMVGMQTGFKKLDTMTGGMGKGELIVMAARPSVGKSALMSQIAKNVALADYGPVYIASLEMTKDQLITRLMCEIAGVNSRNLKELRLTEPEIMALERAQVIVKNLSITIDDTPEVDTHHISAMAQSLASKEGPLALICIDYLQLAHYPGSGNRVEEVTRIAESFKALAKQQDCPVIALSQLSRNLESREDKRPMLSDLRESGGIEAAANQVWMLYREGYHLKKEVTGPEVTEVIVAKNRDGATGKVDLQWEADITRFGDAPLPQGIVFKGSQSWQGDQ